MLDSLLDSLPDSLIVPLFVTTDLPPHADLAEFGQLLVQTARTLDHDDVSYPAFLAGKVFWLDRPAPSEAEPRFAALLGYLAASGAWHTSRDVVADARRAIGAAVTSRYGDVDAAPAVFAIRDRDVRERTPESAVYVDTRDAPSELVTVTRPYL
jgi:hypothetical protein